MLSVVWISSRGDADDDGNGWNDDADRLDRWSHVVSVSAERG